MSALFEQLTFRTGLRARNRVVLAPMTNKQSHADGSISDTELAWLCSRAEGGFGTVMTCAAHVAKDGQGWPGELGVFDDALLPGLTRLAAGLRARGAVSIVQIFHGGLRANPAVTGTLPMERERGGRGEGGHARRSRARRPAVCRRRRSREGRRLRRRGAARSARVPLHAVPERRAESAHRRLGGPLENRARLLRQAVHAVRSAVGPAFTVGVRLSPEDFGNARGLDLDESLQVARWLAGDGDRLPSPVAVAGAPAHHEAAGSIRAAALPRGDSARHHRARGRERSGRVTRLSVSWGSAPTAWCSAGPRSSITTGRCAPRSRVGAAPSARHGGGVARRRSRPRVHRVHADLERLRGRSRRVGRV